MFDFSSFLKDGSFSITVSRRSGEDSNRVPEFDNQEKGEKTMDTYDSDRINGFPDSDRMASDASSGVSAGIAGPRESAAPWYDIANIVPHCPVVLVLDTSHSMWGQGVIDLQNSIAAFYRSVNQTAFAEAQIEVEAIRMGENFGVMESFTPVLSSTLPGTAIRPKGNTPLGASLELALRELEKQLQHYRQLGYSSVTPQLIVLSDGKSSDDFTAAAGRIRRLSADGRLVCRAVALGGNPDCAALASFAGDAVVKPLPGALPEAFAEIGRVVSQSYDDGAVEVIDASGVLENMSSVTPENMPFPALENTPFPALENTPVATPENKPEDAGDDRCLLDGTNMLYWDEFRSGISLEHLICIAGFLRDTGRKYLVFFDATTPHILRRFRPEEVQRYQDILQADPEHFRQVPAGTRADDFLLEEADQHPGTVIFSRDRFRDYVERYPWLDDRKRLAAGMVMDDKIYFPQLNLQIPRK